ncbi:hypothetical protein BpHYR1_029282 [Brachionus plicatilis]|uniref:Uncharacterized protein n=1 Tax=Brachionus plicatilis TaxID=10195 RepID=A0A3M7PXZ8_BRAPC|nr:hypothetical protein BpHYR1_029282 [Brachionus plicatilis]
MKRSYGSHSRYILKTCDVKVMNLSFFLLIENFLKNNFFQSIYFILLIIIDTIATIRMITIIKLLLKYITRIELSNCSFKVHLKKIVPFIMKFVTAWLAASNIEKENFIKFKRKENKKP